MQLDFWTQMSSYSRMLFLGLLLTFASIADVSAQNNWLVFSSIEPASITVCGDPERFGLTISNIHTSNVTGITVTVQMPPGMLYEVGSGVNNGVTENNIANLNAPVFNLPDLASSGGSVSFLYSASAGCDIIPFVNSGSEAQMDVTANFTGGFDEYLSPDWNVLFPSISVLSITNQSFTGNVGSTFTRTITLINGGNGALLKPFTFRDVSGAGIVVPGSNPAGVFTGMGTEYAITISDYSSFGNNDFIWDAGEAITIDITYQVLTCANLGTNFNYQWGCNSQNCQTGTSTGNVVIPANLPNLLFLTTNSQSSCFGLATPNTQTLRIVNNGLAPAMNLTLNVYMFISGTGFSNANMSEIDTSSIRIQRGAAGPLVKPIISSVTLNDSTGGTGGARSCIQGDGIANVGRYITNLGTVNPGDTLFLTWNVHNCCPSVCNNRDNYFNGWRFTGTYQNQCQTQTYTISETAGRNVNHIGVGFNNSASGITDVDAATPGCVSIEINNADWAMAAANNNAPSAFIAPSLAANGAYLEWRVTFPANLTYVPGSAVFRDADGTVWPIMAGYPTFAAGVLTVRFDIANINNALINNWAWIGSSFNYCVLAQCGTSGSATLVNSMNLVPNPGCACSIPVLCRNYTMNAHCPLVCPEGLDFQRFSFWRSSFGQPDYAPEDGTPDGGALDTTQIRIDRAMFGDTLSTYYAGVVRTDGTPNYWRRGFIYSTFSEGDRHTTVLGADIRIWDASAGIYRSANLTAAQTSNFNDAGNARSYRICFSPAYLNTIAPGQFPAGMVLSNGDSVFVRMRYRVSTNIGGATANDLITTNRFYVSNDSTVATTNATTEPAAANRFQCDNWTGAITLIGYYFENWGPSTVQASSCNNFSVSQSYYMSIGPCCSNYNGGNLFPREYRQWSTLDSMRLTTPPGYTFVSATHTESRTRATTLSTTPAATAIVPTVVSANVFNFNVRSRYTTNGGTFQPSDDGYSGTINAFFQPTCGVAQGNGQFYWCDYYSTQPILQIAGAAAAAPSECVNVPAGNSSNVDTVFYNRPNLQLAAVLPTVEGIDSFVSWDIVLQNTAVGSNAANSWIALQTPPTIQVQSVTDLATMNPVLPSGGGIYQLGTTTSGANRNYRIRARYSNCSRDSLIVHTGWNCTSYPVTRPAYPCNTDTIRLYLVPQVPELLVSILQAPAGTVDLCDLATYEIQVTNIQPGTAYNNFFYMIAPSGNGLTVEPGTAEILYPTSGAYVPLPNPSQFGLFWAWNISLNQATLLANGLRGIREPTINSYRIRFQVRTNCNFNSGSKPRFYAQASRPCGGNVSHFVTGPSLNLTGAASNYNTAVSSVTIDTLRACAANPNIRIKVVNLGPAATGSNDSYTFTINSGANFEAGSFVGIHNPPAVGTPSSTIVGPDRQLSWTMPSGVAAGDSVVFSFRISGQNLPCGANEFESSTTTTSSLLCVSTMTPCQIRVNTGTTTDSIMVEKAELSFPMFDATWGVGAGVQVDFTFLNSGDSVYPGAGTDFDVYIDSDSNGVFSAGDIPLGTVAYNDSINPGGLYPQSAYLPYAANIPNPHFIVVAQPPASPCVCDTVAAQELNLTVLPVELLSFTATALGPNQVALDWVTTREINSDYFDVERSPDAASFSLVGTHRAAGNSNGPLLYTLQDNQPLQGMSYYRLRMVDLNGSITYSDLAAIWLNAETGLSAHIFPNPTDGLLTVQVSEPVASVPDFQVYTPTGQRVEIPIRLQGPTTWALDLTSQPAGIYHLRFVLDGRLVHHKVVVR